MRPWPISPNRSKRPCHSGSANATDWVTRRHLPRKPHTCVCLGGSSGGSVQFPVLGPLRIWYRISMGLQWPHTASALSSASGWFSDGSGWLAADKALCPLHLRARRVCLASGSSCNVVCPVVPRVLFVPLVLLWYVFRNEVRFRFNVHHHLESCPLQGFTAHPNPWAKRYPRGGLGTNLRLPRRSLSVIFLLAGGLGRLGCFGLVLSDSSLFPISDPPAPIRRTRTWWTSFLRSLQPCARWGPCRTLWGVDRS